MKPLSRRPAAGTGISAELLLAVPRATAALPEPQQAHIADRQVNVLPWLGKRAGGLRCSRVHPASARHLPPTAIAKTFAMAGIPLPGITGFHRSITRACRAARPSRQSQNRVICESSH